MSFGILQDTEEILRLLCRIRERRTHGRHLITLSMDEDGNELVNGQVQALKTMGRELLDVRPVLLL